MCGPATLVDVRNPSEGRARGLAWIIAAVLAWTVNPAVLLFVLLPTGIRKDCSRIPGTDDYPPDCPREGLVYLAAAAVIFLWVYFTGFAALVAGALEGSRRRFAKVVPAVLVTIAMPWAMVGFAIGNGIAQWVTAAADRRVRTG
ncbi:hypothetical protein Adu01nite_24720 [Paractinoplanes durhamensis]|uniref:Uncharacterized protein n=1 Tax=Paractinoplanes durhamensis TaxID=113563 RepID=A0ABQ3YU77_9ACTN|nr:hypothetical protein Adu01nite_24720 [Actinoplanes durhamensis]